MKKELEKAGRDPDSREGVSLLTMHASRDWNLIPFISLTVMKA